MPGPEARLGLGRAGPAVLLQEPVRVLAPAGALADQLDLGLALAHHHPLDERGERVDRLAGDLAQRRPCVAEDARVAVLVRAQRPGDADVGEHAGEQPHRVLLARILRIRLDVLEVGLVADALDLELGHERRQLAGAVRRSRRPAARWRGTRRP